MENPFLENQLLTIDEVAQILSMHPKTVRRYVREEILKASKIGGEWRVKVSDLKALIDGESFSVKREQDEIEKIKEFVEGKSSQIHGKTQVCTIVDVYVNTEEEAGAISQELIKLMNSRDPDQPQSKYNYSFIEESKKARFTLWGNTKFISKMLNIISSFDLA